MYQPFNPMSECTYAPMKLAMAAGAMAYSMRIAVPVRNQPHGPMARRAKAYPQPVVEMVDDSSTSPKTMKRYMTAMMMVAMSRPPQPPWPRPKFQPA